jgi:WD40 repeat protein
MALDSARLLPGHALERTIRPDGRRVLTGSRDGTARLWNLDGTLEAVLDPKGGIVWLARFSPDGRRIVTASFASTRLWIANPEELLAAARSRLTGLRSMLSDAEWQTYRDLIE